MKPPIYHTHFGKRFVAKAARIKVRAGNFHSDQVIGYFCAVCGFVPNDLAKRIRSEALVTL